jgi:hypothetical protein
MNNALKFALMLGTAATVLAVSAFAGNAGVCTDIPNGGCSSVPEPSTIAMLASGLGAVVVLRHWRKR